MIARAALLRLAAGNARFVAGTMTNQAAKFGALSPMLEAGITSAH